MQAIEAKSIDEQLKEAREESQKTFFYLGVAHYEARTHREKMESFELQAHNHSVDLDKLQKQVTRLLEAKKQEESHGIGEIHA